MCLVTSRRQYILSFSIIKEAKTKYFCAIHSKGLCESIQLLAKKNIAVAENEKRIAFRDG